MFCVEHAGSLSTMVQARDQKRPILTFYFQKIKQLWLSLRNLSVLYGFYPLFPVSCLQEGGRSIPLFCCYVKKEMAVWSPRSFSVVPWPCYALALAGLVLQLAWHGVWPPAQARLVQWPEPVPAPWLRVFSMGEPVVLAKGLMLWLQAFDYQAGVALTLSDLDMERLEGWLDRLLDLDPRAQYPLLVAVRYYGDLASLDQQRRLGAFAYRRFLEDPQSRWPWLAHAAIAAKHRLHDLPLAVQYARAIRRHATGAHVPSWAKQMEIVLLEEMGEWQDAQFLIGGLLSDGTVQDAQEIHFWTERLHLLQEKSKESANSPGP